MSNIERVGGGERGCGREGERKGDWRGAGVKGGGMSGGGRNVRREEGGRDEYDTRRTFPTEHQSTDLLK